MNRDENEAYWEAIFERLRALSTLTGPRALAAFAEVLAVLDECLAECFAEPGTCPCIDAELGRLADGLRHAATNLGPAPCTEAQQPPFVTGLFPGGDVHFSRN